MQPKMIEGTIVETREAGASEIERLRNITASLSQQLNETLLENDELRKRLMVADAPIARLREKLEPFYKLLQAIFGDIEEIDPIEATERESAPPALLPIWNSWKQKLGGQCAKIIDVLLTHREMNTTQLAIAIGTRRQNIPNLIYKMNQAGLINKNGGRFSLKQL